MSPAETAAAPSPEVVTRGEPRGRAAWIELATSADHKDVGRLYIGTALAFGALALCLLVLTRLQLIMPDSTMIDYTIFGRLLSAYGATAIVLFALPLAIGFATYVVPLQIGARGVALPRLGALSWWLYVAGGLTIWASFLYHPSEAGVIPFPPLSDDVFLPQNAGVDAWIAGVSLAVAGLVCAAVNLVVTLHRMRAPGMAWRRTPLFSWAAAVVSYLLLASGPVLIAALAMLFYDRHHSGVFFDAAEGGAPILFQHLSFVFFTCAYLAIVLFACGVVSEVVATLSRKPVFSHGAIAASMVAVGAVGFFAWMQNMYTSDIARGFQYFAMAAALALLVPFGVIVFNWVATLWGGSLRLRAALWFALGAISAMSFGLAGELAGSLVPLGWWFGNTATGWSDTHYALIGAAAFGGFAALHYWFPKLTGRTMGEGLGKASFWAMFIGLQATLLPLQVAGLEGQPADISEYFEGSGLAGWNLVATIGSFVLAAGVVLALANAAWSVRHGAAAGPDPWGGTTLEWFAASPPPEHNFDAIPDVRSAEPLRDIRRAVRERATRRELPAARERGEGEPSEPAPVT